MAQGVSGRDVPGNAGGLYVSPGDGGAAESDRATGMPGPPEESALGEGEGEHEGERDYGNAFPLERLGLSRKQRGSLSPS